MNAKRTNWVATHEFNSGISNGGERPAAEVEDWFFITYETCICIHFVLSLLAHRGYTGCILDTWFVFPLFGSLFWWSETKRDREGKKRVLMKSSLRDKESHQSPWCVTWPGPCHHWAPVVAKKYPPPPPHHLLSFITQPRERDRKRERGGETVRQTDRESPDRGHVSVCHMEQI